MDTNRDYWAWPDIYLQLTNISDQEVIVIYGAPIGWWMDAEMIPRSPVYVSVGSRRYNEWQTLAYEATTDQKKEVLEGPKGPLVDYPSYPTPTKILICPNKKEKEKTTNVAI